MKDKLKTFLNDYSNLTKKQQGIIEYIMNNPYDVCNLSLKELAKRTGVSEVLILKVCDILGFENYKGLKNAFQNHNDQLITISDIEDLARQNPSDSNANKKVLFNLVSLLEQRNMVEMINNLDTDLIFKCGQELLKSREIIVFGHNASKTLADYLAHRLNYMHLKAYSIKLGDNDIVKTALAKINIEDFVVIFSFPPYYYPTAEVVRHAQMKGIKIATITNSLQSPAISERDYTFICKTESIFFYNSLSLPMKFVELLTTNMAIQLGENLNQITKEELLVSKFISGRN